MSKMATEERLIDANKVINAMQKCLDECSPDEKNSVAYFAFESIIECLKQEPTVDAVEVVHGRWENVTGGMVTLGDCSECKVRQPVFGTNYCKHCGAKMDGDGNG